jgi:hypothetical protein
MFNVESPLKVDNDLLNYWNLRQVIYVRGIRMPTFEVDFVFKKLLEQELIQSFEIIPKSFDFSVMHNQNLIEPLMKKVREHGDKFENRITQLAMPMRLSLMVPISNKRISVFEPQIIELMNYFIDKGFTFQK